MRRTFTALIAGLVIACMASQVMPNCASAATTEPTEEQIDSAPCMAAVTAREDERIIADCAPLIDNDKAVAWLRKGAQPTDRVQRILQESGAWDEFKGGAKS